MIELQKKNNQIISCGGGVALRDENVAEMKKNGKVVLLTASPEVILESVSKTMMTDHYYVGIRILNLFLI